MEKFTETFKHVALKYAEYVEAKIISSTKIAEMPIGPGQAILIESNETAKEYREDMQVLCQITEILKNLESDVIELSEAELCNLHPTDAEIEAYQKAIVCYMEQDAETGAVEIIPNADKDKIILADEGQIKAFMRVVGSFLKKDHT